MIPRQCVQFWHDTQALPRRLHEAIQCNAVKNPDFEFHLLNDNDVCLLLDKSYPKGYVDLYQRITIPAARSDIASFLWLYEFGGIYLDVSMEFSLPFPRLFNFSDDLFLVRRDDIPKYQTCPEQAHAIVGIMAAKAHCNLMRRCLQQAFKNIRAGYYNYNVSQAVGPVMFNQVLNNYDSENGKINYYSFKQLLATNSLRYLRVPGFANTWVKNQKEGIVDPEFYNTK